MQQVHHEGVVSQQYSSCNDNYCHRSINHHNPSSTNARRRHSTQESSGRLGKYMPQISSNECGINNKTSQKELQAKQKQSHHDTYTMRHVCNDCWTSRKSKHLAEPVTLTSDERTSTSNDNKNTILVKFL
jgi:hypothetical protein